MNRLARFEADLLCGIARLFTGVSIKGCAASKFDTGKEPFVFYANHSSHLDAVVLWLSLPPAIRERTRPVAAKDYWQGGPIRRHIAVRVLNALLVQRASSGSGAIDRSALVDSFNSLKEALDAGSSLILFPEGTRGDGDTIEQFKSGIYRLARHRPTAIFVPVYLENLNRVLPKGEFLPVPLLGSVYFGDGITLREEERKDEFLSRAWKALNSLQEATS